MSEYKPKTLDSASRSERPSKLSPASELVTVSEQMVDAGVAVLWSSGVVEGRLGSDGLLVAEIYRAMNAASSQNIGKAK